HDARPICFNILLQVLDDGRLTDGQGRTVDFRNTVVVMTSNLGSDRIQAMSDEADYQAMKATVMETVARHFRPEFLNRIDEVVVFHALDKAEIRAIADLQVERVAGRLREQDIVIEVSAAARELLGEAGFDPVYGARPLRRTVQNRLETPLAKDILAGRFGPGDRILVDATDGTLTFNRDKARASAA